MKRLLKVILLFGTLFVIQVVSVFAVSATCSTYIDGYVTVLTNSGQVASGDSLANVQAVAVDWHVQHVQNSGAGSELCGFDIDTPDAVVETMVNRLCAAIGGCSSGGGNTGGSNNNGDSGGNSSSGGSSGGATVITPSESTGSAVLLFTCVNGDCQNRNIQVPPPVEYCRDGYPRNVYAANVWGTLGPNAEFVPLGYVPAGAKVYSSNTLKAMGERWLPAQFNLAMYRIQYPSCG